MKSCIFVWRPNIFSYIGTFSIIANIKNIAIEVNKRSDTRNECKSEQGIEGERRGERKKQERYSELTLQPEVAGQDW